MEIVWACVCMSAHVCVCVWEWLCSYVHTQVCVLILLDALVCVRLNVQVCEFFCVCDTSDCFCEDLLKNGVQTIPLRPK